MLILIGMFTNVTITSLMRSHTSTERSEALKLAFTMPPLEMMRKDEKSKFH